MTNPQPNVAGVPPAAAAAATRAMTGENTPDVPDEDLRTTDDGVPVGAADADEDRRRAGADADELPRDVLPEGSLGKTEPVGATDDGVPVGAADAEEDRRRAGGS